MVMPEITLYVARADNGVIGDDGGIPFRLPGEQKHFKDLTMGKPMVMGRRTFESLPGLLPGRRHIVLTRDTGWRAPGAEIAVIGGAEIYRLFMDVARRIELTEVHRSPEGDTKMPPLGSGWRVVNR